MRKRKEIEEYTAGTLKTDIILVELLLDIRDLLSK